LASLPDPDILERLDVEDTVARLKQDLVRRYPQAGPVINDEGEPLVKLLETAAFESVNIRSRINIASLGIMLAKATGPQLDHIGALPFFNLPRRIIIEADPSATPPILEVKESDDEYKARLQLQPLLISAAGQESYYVAKALEASGDIRTANDFSPTPGHVTVALLSRFGDGSVSDELVADVNAYMQPRNRRLIGDVLTVKAARIVPYTVRARLVIGSGPDASEVLASVQPQVRAYAATRHFIGATVAHKIIDASLVVPGVENLQILEPLEDIVTDDESAPFLQSLNIEIAHANA
jgi:phage-related baseplate assembly protein